MDFDFHMLHLSGTKNTTADCLPCLPIPYHKGAREKDDEEMVIAQISATNQRVISFKLENSYEIRQGISVSKDLYSQQMV